MLMLQTLWMVPSVRLLLKLGGLKRTARSFGISLDHQARVNDASRDIVQARSIAIDVDRAARNIVGGTHCLTRSIVLLHLLEQRGLQGQLRIGVTAPRNFRAHAWVEIDGVPINDGTRKQSEFLALEQPGTSPL